MNNIKAPQGRRAPGLPAITIRTLRRALVATTVLAGLFTAACTAQTGETPGDEETVSEAESAEAAAKLGRVIMLEFGKLLSPFEYIECGELNATSETFHMVNCTVTVMYGDCRTEWNGDMGEYVCTCQPNVTSMSGSGC